MNKTLIAGMFSAMALIGTCAQAAIVEEGVYIPGLDKKLVKVIQEHPELSIDHMSNDGFELYGPTGLREWLDEMGVSYRAQHSHVQKESKGRLDYPSYEQISASLKSLAAKYPHIMNLSSIGTSVEGRELWVVKISDNPQVDEVEPEFKYISSMHGDEITGRELTQFWIKDLLEGYGNDPAITELVNNTELYIMPSMNPDGSKRRVRGNANSVDLNRNFPDWTRGDANSSRNRQPETQAVMSFQSGRQFSLSANFHGGAVVVNYPWDSTYDRHPFDELIKGFSLEYASLNPEMRSSREFKDGVTNGADWYRVVGGMQDWSYVFHNDLQVTIELSEMKWPRYSDIAGFYKDNKDSMFVFSKLIHQGAGFKIKNSSTDGRVEVSRILENGSRKNLGSYGFRGGEFYKVLSPGSYVFKVEFSGKILMFETQVNEDNVSENGNYTYLNF